MGASSSGSNPNAAKHAWRHRFPDTTKEDQKRRQKLPPPTPRQRRPAWVAVAMALHTWQARTGTQRRAPRMTRGFVHAQTMCESATVSAPRQTVSAGGRTRRAGLTTWPPFTRHGCGRGHPGRQAGTRVRLARRVLPPPSPSLHTAAAPRRPVGVE